MPDLSYANATFLHELRDGIGDLLEKHIAASDKNVWEPYVTTNRAYEARITGEFDPDRTPLPKHMKSAVYIVQLTEDNLYYYHNTLAKLCDDEAHPFAVWKRRWTSEEGRHAQAIRGVSEGMRLIDPHNLAVGFMKQVSGGVSPELPAVPDGTVYPELQEPTTKLTYQNMIRQFPRTHQIAKLAFANVAGDENLHTAFYVGLSNLGYELDPSTMVMASAKHVINFAMPGEGIPGFLRHAVRMARGNILNQEMMRDEIFRPHIERHQTLNLTGLTPEAQEAQELLGAHMDELDIEIARFYETHMQSADA
jgi:acyl-[acyl-carrier-protein] desaturase